MPGGLSGGMEETRGSLEGREMGIARVMARKEEMRMGTEFFREAEGWQEKRNFSVPGEHRYKVSGERHIFDDLLPERGASYGVDPYYGSPKWYRDNQWSPRYGPSL